MEKKEPIGNFQAQPGRERCTGFVRDQELN
jgi:hypothetical protein